MSMSEAYLIHLAKQRTQTENSIAFYLACSLYDRGTLPLFCLGYAYFRWVDDFIDDPMHSVAACRTLIARQQALVSAAYAGGLWPNDQVEEQMIRYLIHLDPQERLKPYIQDMLAALAWDIQRRGKIPDRRALEAYSLSLGRAYTNALQAFVACGHSYPDIPGRYAAGTAAHLAHILRDFCQDWEIGYYNISWQEIAEFGLGTSFAGFESEAFRRWVRSVVQRARQLFQVGKHYLDSLEIYRCKLLGHLYCLRYEALLDQIEHSSYCIGEGIDVPTSFLITRSFVTLLRVTFQHLVWRHTPYRKVCPTDPSLLPPVV